MYHLFVFIHPPIEGNLGCLKFLPIMDKYLHVDFCLHTSFELITTVFKKPLEVGLFPGGCSWNNTK